MDHHVSRRQVLGAVAAFAMPGVVSSVAWGANTPSRRITMGAIGLGGQGLHNLKSFLTFDDVRVLAVCDVDAGHLQRAKETVDAAYGNGDCAAYRDFREVLARRDLDTVLIATPVHWHAVLAIEAAKAGKDIYCEKPISLTVAEGRAVVEAMNRYNTVYQSGTQRRSIACFRFGVDIARSGALGKLQTLHCYYHNGPACPPQPVEPVPAGFDYDLWLGPAPLEPYTPRRCHGTFRWIYDYSGGQLTDLGAHFVDLAQWAHGDENTSPTQYEGWAEFPKDGLYDTPVRFEITATYPDGVKLVIHDETEPGRGPRGNKYVGTEGWVSVDDTGKVTASSDAVLRKLNAAQRGYEFMEGHHRDFLECVRTRARTIAPPEVAHRSTTTCHITNLCLRLGRKLQWDPARERFVDDPEADRMLSRAMRRPWRL